MKDRIFFGGTAYLSIPRHRGFQELFFEGVRKYGINYGASRNNPTVPDIYKLAEEAVCDHTRSAEAIIVSSGYLAAQMVLQELSGGRRLIYAPDTHPALWRATPAPPPVSFTEWAQVTIKDLNESSDPVMIVSNSLNNLVPEVYDFGWLAQLLPGRDVLLLVDDSHGLGVVGDQGGGVYRTIPRVDGLKTVLIASMAKALGIDGGVICGDKDIIGELRLSPVYAGASPPSPAFMYAYYHGREIYRQQLKRLYENMNYFMARIANVPDARYDRRLPVILAGKPETGEFLRGQGFEISFFPYPDPQGPPLNRIVLSSSHSRAELEGLVKALKQLG